jgi:terminase large subunit-like protein
MTQSVLWQPNPGPQTALVACPIFEVFFGGARGGGKTEGSLGDWLQHSAQYAQGANGVFFRREERQLDEVIARSEELFEPLGAKFNRQKSTWRMRNGARLKFRYLDKDKDAEAYQGHSYTRVYVEEATNFPSFAPIKKLFATLRSARGVPCGIRLTGNPGGPGHHWVFRRYVEPEPLGYKVLTDIIEVDGFPPMEIQRVFIPSKLSDNPLVDQRAYAAQLSLSGTAALVRAWLLGDWSAPVGAYFTQFSRARHTIPARFRALIPQDALRFGSFDWGYAKPYSFGLWAVSDGTWGLPRGALIRYKELYGSTGQPNEGLRHDAGTVARSIKNFIGPDQLTYIAADPSTFKQDGGPSHAETFAGEGVFLRRADNNRLAGWDKVRQHLVGKLGIDYKYEELTVHPPLVYIMDDCKDVISQLEVVPSDPDKPDDVDTTAEDHAVDDLRYGVMSRPWIIDSLPPPSHTRGLTFDQLFAQSDLPRELERV